MKAWIFTALAIYWFINVPTVESSDFFSSSHSENDLDPSKDFFSEQTSEEIDSAEYRSSYLQSGRKGKSNEQYNVKEDLRYKAYLTRFINIFLRSGGFLKDGTTKVDLTLSKEDIIIFEKFVNDEDISLETLENSFRKMFIQEPKPAQNTYSQTIIEYLNYAILIGILLAILVYILFMAKKMNFKISGVSFIILIAYISVVLHALLKQYEDISESIMIKRLEFDNVNSLPRECMYSKMTYLEKIYAHIFKDDTCKRFLQSRKSVWYEMDFVSAAIKPFTSMFSALCTMFGEGSEKIIKPFIERSPWPINVLLEIFLAIMQLPLFFVGLFVIFFALTSRTIYLKIPFILSLAAEKKHKINDDHSKKKIMEENASHPSGSSIKTYVVNKGGVVVLGNEDKQFQSYSIQGSSSSNSLPQSFQIFQQNKGYSIQGSSSPNSLPQASQMFQQNKDSFMSSAIGSSEDAKSGSIFNKHLVLKKKEVRREHKKLIHYKKMNFKPIKKSIALKAAKENLDILPVYDS